MSRQDLGIILWNLLVPTVKYVIFMIQRRSGQKHKKMTCSYKGNEF